MTLRAYKIWSFFPDKIENKRLCKNSLRHLSNSDFDKINILEGQEYTECYKKRPQGNTNFLKRKDMVHYTKEKWKLINNSGKWN